MKVCLVVTVSEIRYSQRLIYHHVPDMGKFGSIDVVKRSESIQTRNLGQTKSFWYVEFGDISRFDVLFYRMSVMQTVIHKYMYLWMTNSDAVFKIRIGIFYFEMLSQSDIMKQDRAESSFFIPPWGYVLSSLIRIWWFQITWILSFNGKRKRKNKTLWNAQVRALITRHLGFLRLRNPQTIYCLS